MRQKSTFHIYNFPNYLLNIHINYNKIPISSSNSCLRNSPQNNGSASKKRALHRRMANSKNLAVLREAARKITGRARGRGGQSHGRAAPWQAVTRVPLGARVSRCCPQIARNYWLLLFSRHTPRASSFHVISTCLRDAPLSHRPRACLPLLRLLFHRPQRLVPARFSSFALRG